MILIVSRVLLIEAARMAWSIAKLWPWLKRTPTTRWRWQRPDTADMEGMATTRVMEVIGTVTAVTVITGGITVESIMDTMEVTDIMDEDTTEAITAHITEATVITGRMADTISDTDTGIVTDGTIVTGAGVTNASGAGTVTEESIMIGGDTASIIVITDTTEANTTTVSA